MLDLENLRLNLIILILVCGFCSISSPSHGQSSSPSDCQLSAGVCVDPKGCPAMDCHPVSSLESLLRNESQLTARFEDLLNQTPTTIDQKYNFMLSLEDLIRRQSILLATFEDILHIAWNRMSENEQMTFLCSFEDLVERQFILLSNFESMIQEDWSAFGSDSRLELLSSYEDLLRKQSNLIKSYEELYRSIHGGISIEKNVNKINVHSGDTVVYTYIVTNWFSDQPIMNISIIDDVLGPIVSNVSLKPQETRYFSKGAVITGDTCNKAQVVGTVCSNKTERAESNIICVKVMRVGKNNDSIKVGNQISSSFGTADPPTASNSLEIKKDQRANCSECEISNSETIEIGDQIASSSLTGVTNNRIKIVTSQD